MSNGHKHDAGWLTRIGPIPKEAYRSAGHVSGVGDTMGTQLEISPKEHRLVGYMTHDFRSIGPRLACDVQTADQPTEADFRCTSKIFAPIATSKM